jgi:hypothetical protein
VVVPETAVAKKEGSLAAPGTAEAEMENSLAAPEMAEAEMENSLAAETETAVETAAETKAVEKEGDTAVEAGTVEEVEGHESETEAGTVEEVEEEESAEEAGTVEEVEDEESVEEAGTVEEVEGGAVLVNVAEAAAFKLYQKLETVDPKLVMGNTEEERFADKYRLGQMSDLEREAELAKRHDALKAHQDMEELQKHQPQLAQMRAAVDEQMKRREVEALGSRNKVSFLF